MFKCDCCKKAIGPKVSPFVSVVESRPVSYTFDRIDPETEEVIQLTSVGSEVVREEKLCPECAQGLEGAPKLGTPATVDYTKTINLALLMQEHGKRCKDTPSECKVCQRNMEFFGALPLNVLNIVLSDKVVAAPRFRTGAVVAASAGQRDKQGSKRAASDVVAAATVFAKHDLTRRERVRA